MAMRRSIGITLLIILAVFTTTAPSCGKSGSVTKSGNVFAVNNCIWIGNGDGGEQVLFAPSSGLQLDTRGDIADSLGDIVVANGAAASLVGTDKPGATPTSACAGIGGIKGRFTVARIIGK